MLNQRLTSIILMISYLLFNSVMASAHMAEEQSSMHEPAHLHFHLNHDEDAEHANDFTSDHEHEAEEAHFHLSEPLENKSIFQKSQIPTERIIIGSQPYSPRITSPPTPPPTL